MSDKNSIISIQMDLTKVVEDMYNKIKEVIRKYGSGGGIPLLPDYEVIIKSSSLYYKSYNECMKIGDDIVYVQMSLGLVLTSLNDIKNTKLNRELSNEYSLMQNFRKFLDGHIDTLTSFKYDLIELKRQVTDRVKLLQNIQFQ